MRHISDPTTISTPGAHLKELGHTSNVRYLMFWVRHPSPVTGNDQLSKTCHLFDAEPVEKRSARIVRDDRKHVKSLRYSVVM